MILSLGYGGGRSFLTPHGVEIHLGIFSLSNMKEDPFSRIEFLVVCLLPGPVSSQPSTMI